MSLLTLYQLLLDAVAQSKADADSGAAIEAAILIALQGDDAAAVADVVALIALGDAETGAALDAALQVALSSADAAAGAEAVSGIGLSQQESAAGSEAASGIALAGDEPVSAGDLASSVGLSSADAVSALEDVFAIGVGAPDVAAAQEGAAIGLGDAELVQVSELAAVTAVLQADEPVTTADAVVFAGEVVFDSDSGLALDEAGEIVVFLPPVDAAGYAEPSRWLQGQEMEFYFGALAAMMAEGVVDAEELAILMTMAWTEPLAAG